MSGQDPAAPVIQSSTQVVMTACEVERLPTVVAIDSLRVAGSPRSTGENLDHIRMMAALDEQLPAIIVHRPTMRVIDGIHRLRAAEMRGDRDIEVHMFDGDDADAFVLAVKANTTHGLPLSKVDRLAAAERILTTHPHWSDRTIAANAGLATKTVASIRSRSSGIVPEPVARLGRDGKVRPLDGAAGRLHAGKFIIANPDASLREIAEVAGISPATAMDVRNRLRRGDGPLPAERAHNRNKDGRTGKPPSPRAASPGDFIRGLQKDPSLRSNEKGRALLRLLSLALIDEDTREQLIACVPPYRADTVAVAAAECAAVWQEFAAQMKRRSNTQTTG